MGTRQEGAAGPSSSGLDARHAAQGAAGLAAGDHGGAAQERLLLFFVQWTYQTYRWQTALILHLASFTAGQHAPVTRKSCKAF